MAEYVFDYDGWAAAMKEAVGPAWAYGLYKAIAKVMHARKHERIVRCKDCKHSSVSFDETRTMCRYWAMNDYDDSESSHGYTLYPVVEPDGFCKWGERRDDG